MTTDGKTLKQLMTETIRQAVEDAMKEIIDDYPYGEVVGAFARKFIEDAKENAELMIDADTGNVCLYLLDIETLENARHPSVSDDDIYIKAPISFFTDATPEWPIQSEGQRDAKLEQIKTFEVLIKSIGDAKDELVKDAAKPVFPDDQFSDKLGEALRADKEPADLKPAEE